MSTSETTEHKVGLCPCGAGDIIKSITTQDNSWSGADISVRINCSKCSAEWHVLYNSLILRSSEQEAIRAGQNVAEIEKQLIAAIEPLFEKYFAGVKTKKAELAELQRLGINQDSYRGYLEARRTNPSIAQCVSLSKILAGLEASPKRAGVWTIWRPFCQIYVKQKKLTSML